MFISKYESPPAGKEAAATGVIVNELAVETTVGGTEPANTNALLLFVKVTGLVVVTVIFQAVMFA